MSGKPLFTRTTTPDLLGTLLKGKNYKRKIRECSYKRQEALSKVSGNYDHPLIFEYWLAGQGADTKLFWKNCKVRYSCHKATRKELKHRTPSEWVLYSFDWQKALSGEEAYWYKLDRKWEDLVGIADDNNRTILFGFGKYGDFK